MLSDQYGPYMEIVLTKGYVAKVSPEDYTTLSKNVWCFNHKDSPYAVRGKMIGGEISPDPDAPRADEPATRRAGKS